MNANAQRIEIAQLLGWTKPRSAIKGAGSGHRQPGPYGFPPGRAYEAEIPDYPRDLNACAKFAELLAGLGWRCVANMGMDGTWECFFTQRGEITATPGEWDHYGAGDTLAIAICEAGLRALGKWRD